MIRQARGYFGIDAKAYGHVGHVDPGGQLRLRVVDQDPVRAVRNAVELPVEHHRGVPLHQTPSLDMARVDPGDKRSCACRPSRGSLIRDSVCGALSRDKSFYNPL